MENLRNDVPAKIVRSREEDKISRYDIFGNDLASIHMHKTKLSLNKPMYTGMTILENTKILMYDFFYDHLKAKYEPKCELIYTDTDSLILDIQMQDVCKDMEEDIWLCDTSNLSSERSPALHWSKQRRFWAR